MRRFFLYLFLILLGTIVADLVFGFVLQHMYASVKKADCGRINFMMTELKDKDILIFGSSRAIHHYDPKIISDQLGMSCYNCGEDGMGIILSYARLKAILSRYTPKMIIYDFEKSYDLNCDDNYRYLGKLKPFYPDYGVDSIFNDISYIEKFKMMSHLYRYNSQLIDIAIGLFSKFPDADDKYTYSPLGNVMDYEPKHQSHISLSVDSTKVKYLCRFIDVCKEKSTQLVFVVSPSYQADSIDWKRILSKVSDNRKVTVLNHYSDTIFSAHRELFSDEVHLNKDGSIEYTKMISKEIQQLMNNYAL